MDFEEIGISVGNWVNVAQDRDLLEGPCECSIEPPGSISHGVSYVGNCWSNINVNSCSDFFI